MLVSRAFRDELMACRAERDELRRNADRKDDLIGILCARVNHLEMTQVVLLRHITHLELPAPQVKATSIVTRESDRQYRDGLAELFKAHESDEIVA